MSYQILQGHTQRFILSLHMFHLSLCFLLLIWKTARTCALSTTYMLNLKNFDALLLLRIRENMKILFITSATRARIAAVNSFIMSQSLHTVTCWKSIILTLHSVNRYLTSWYLSSKRHIIKATTMKQILQKQLIIYSVHSR